MRDIDELFRELARSDFRSSKRLNEKDRAYLALKGLDTITDHAVDFITKRLAPAVPDRDGKQTPWKGHPVFVAQHATATCCRSCLAKWHRIEKGRQLTQEEIEYVVAVLRRWMSKQLVSTAQ